MKLESKKDEKTEYGQFLSFEYLTYVPIDLEPVDVSLMEEQDVAWLNEYHAQVYEKIAPHLTEEEAAWRSQSGHWIWPFVCSSDMESDQSSHGRLTIVYS